MERERVLAVCGSQLAWCPVERDVRANATFFRYLTVASGNRVLLRVQDEADYAMRRNTSGWRPYGECPDQRRVEYLALRDAVAARDGVAAEALIRKRHGYA